MSACKFNKEAATQVDERIKLDKMSPAYDTLLTVDKCTEMPLNSNHLRNT